MEIQSVLQPQQYKSDQVYHLAYRELSSSNKQLMVLQACKMIPFIILIPVNLQTLDVPYGTIIIAFILNLVASALGLLYQLSLLMKIYRNVNVFLLLAASTRHTVDREAVDNPTEIDECVSESIFIGQSEVRAEDMDEMTRGLHLKITKNSIESTMKKEYIWVRVMDALKSFVAFSTMVFSIVVLAINEDMPIVDKFFLSLYVFFVAMTQVLLVVICLLALLSPLICVVILVLYCFCSTKESKQGEHIDLDSRPATNNEVVECGGDCAICMMSISIGSKVFVLPCSQKHVFHRQCLKQWAKVKNTCPICRAQIPMTDSKRQVDDGQGSGRE